MKRAKEKHTPGPWVLDPTVNGWVLVSNGQDVTSEAFDCTEADAKLIAAAPDMLEALRDLVDALALDKLEDGGEVIEQAYREQFAQARAAIAKAEGR